MTGQAPAAGHLLVVSLAPYDASCTLFFTHLADRLPLRIVQYPGDDIARALSGARAVIVVRGLFEFGNVVVCARRLGIPLYYFIDDNFMLIREERGIYGDLCASYSPEGVRAALRDFTGVLLATKSLIDYFTRERLHDRLTLYPPVAGPIFEMPAPAPAHRLTIAFFGGHHRREPFIRYVYPAVRRLAGERAVTLVAAGIEPGSLPPAEGVEVICPRYDPSYTIALEQVARYGVDILVHPASPTANNIYKNPHVLINAHVIGALPIFSNVAPYDAVAAEGVAVLCEDTEEAWYDALTRVATDADFRQTMLSRLDAYCERNFSGATNLDALRAIERAHPAPAPLSRVTRWVVGAGHLAMGRVQRRLAQALKPSRAR